MIKGSSSSQPVQFISTQKKLDAAVQALSGVPSFAFDLEFDRDRYSYGFTLCLVQLATPEVCFVIDPLASVSLAPLFALFEDPAIQKIMHSGGEDLRLLHALGCFPQNLYDTDITARLLNYEQCSLAALLFDVMGLLLHKGEQKSNWLKRPLTEGQINYAANDVIYLHWLKEALEEKLAGRPAAALLQSEQAMLSTTKYLPEEKVWFLRKEDERSLSPYEQHVLNALYVLRDQKARLLDKPAYQVMEESLLRPLATAREVPQCWPASPHWRGRRARVSRSSTPGSPRRTIRSTPSSRNGNVLTDRSLTPCRHDARSPAQPRCHPPVSATHPPPGLGRGGDDPLGRV